jgi:hypothetical protein
MSTRAGIAKIHDPAGRSGIIMAIDQINATQSHDPPVTTGSMKRKIPAMPKMSKTAGIAKIHDPAGRSGIIMAIGKWEIGQKI